MNNKKQPTNQSENTLTEIFKYEVKEGVSEFHVMIHSTRPEDTMLTSRLAPQHGLLLVHRGKPVRHSFLVRLPTKVLTPIWIAGHSIRMVSYRS